jgi:hypothetical protein
LTDEEGVMTSNGSLVAVLVSPDEFEAWRERYPSRPMLLFMDDSEQGGLP